MSNEHDFDPAFLARYFAGESSHEEARRFERWVAERPERQALLDELRDAWRIFGDVHRESYDVEAAWTKIRAGARARPQLRLMAHQEPARIRIARRLVIAASLILAVAGSLAGYHVLRVRPASLATAEPTVHTIATAPGQRMSLRLADGTLVVLAPASTLRFAATYGSDDRAVQLTGEAAFTVVHDDRRPFTVRTPRLFTHDLGTRFVVRAYAGDSAEQVVVAEGKVEVSRDSSRVLLSRGDGVRVTSDGRLALARDVPLDSYFAWTEGRLVFRRTPLGEVARRLERWHDVEIRLASAELERLGFTASFPAGQSVGEMLDVVTAVLGLEAEPTGPRSYTLTRRRR